VLHGPAAAGASNARGPASCRPRTPAMGRRPAPPGGGRAGKGPSRPNTRTRWPPGGTVRRHGGFPDRRGEVDGPEAGRERVEELGADDERGPLAWEMFPKAQVEGVGRVVQHQDGAGPAEDVEAGIAGGPQGDAAPPGLGGDERARAVGRAGDGRPLADDAVYGGLRGVARSMACSCILRCSYISLGLRGKYAFY
jgi:hypothetical protein